VDMTVPEYYCNARKEILGLLPPDADKILEIGCGAGATLSFIKSIGKCRWVGGIELVPEAAKRAGEQLDWLLEGDVEQLEIPLENGSVDVILCLDVLEHLVDPWTIISRLHRKLKLGGSLIASIPNVRNLKIILPLLIRGTWTYEDSGLLDRTHLRFFTKSSARELVECSGLLVDRIETTGMFGKVAIANSITLKLFEELFAVQYLIRAGREK